MSEAIQLRDPLFKLIVRFTNGEIISYIASEPIDPRMLSSDTRYAVINSISCQNPSDCVDVAVVNLRDITFIKTERVTLEQLAAERRLAGIHSVGAASAEDKLPKTLAQVKFI